MKVKEIKLICSVLFSKFDDWIILGLKNENDYFYQCVRYSHSQLLQNLSDQEYKESNRRRRKIIPGFDSI